MLEAGIVHEDQDANTIAGDNAFGGHVNPRVGVEPGGFGSANGDTNVWPVKNAVDVDITDLIKWKLGQNPSYSDFDPGDRELTVMIRTDFQDTEEPNGFVRYVSNESWLARRDIGDFQLEPARIVLSVANPFDFNEDGVIDANDIDLLTANIGAGDLTFDVDRNGQVNQSDVDALVKVELKTFFGDANLDGEFNSGDLVEVFQAGKYELDVQAGWAQGDWTGDGRFDSSDFVAAFQDGGFEQGPQMEVNTVPEPSSAVLIGFGLILALRMRIR